MFKRVLLSLTFVAALGAASLGMSSKANAYGCGYGVYGVGYGYYPTYSSYYGYPGSAIVVRRAPIYPVYYGFDGHRHHHHRHHRHGGIRVSFGF
jgi:hypothetical protein